jgi:signal transduction histidine kinase
MANFILAPIFGSAANLVLAVFVLLQNPRNRLNRAFFVFGLSLAMWCGAASATRLVKTEQAAEFWVWVVHTGVIWSPVTGLHVCLLAARVHLPRFLRTCYIVTSLFMIAHIFGWHIQGVQPVVHGWFARANWGFWLFTNVMPCITLPAVGALIYRRRRVEPDKKRKYSILIFAKLLLIVTGTHDVAAILGWTHYPGTNLSLYPWGTAAAGIYGLLVGYGALQDQVLDFRVTLSRYVAFLARLVFFFAVTFILLFFASAIGPQKAFSLYAFGMSLAVMLVGAAITGVMFPKLFGGTSERLERRLLGDNFEYQEQIQALADTVHRHGDLHGMWQEIGATLNIALRAAPISCLLLGARKFAVAFRGMNPADHPAMRELDHLGPECALIRYFQLPGARVLDVRHVPVFRRGGLAHEARSEAEAIGAEYVFALASSDRVTGFLAVGSKHGQTPFTAIDIELLSRLAQRIGWATERTLLGEQLAMAGRHELLSMMSRGLAHDLNNLLTPVSTVIQLSAGQYPTGSNEEQLLEAAGRSVRVIRDYVEQAIFFAKDLQPRMTRLELGLLLADVKAVVENRAERKGVSIEWKPTTGALVADGVLCQRMLANLVTNAIDACSAGQRVTVEATENRMRGVVRFVVIDTGIGIPPEQQAMVFQPYFTTKDSGDHGEQRGFGLGLTVCQLIVELHQGVITLQSEVGKGTRVAVELPVESAGPPVFVPTHIPI